MTTVDAVEGQTAPIDIQLMASSAVAGDMTGQTLGLELKGNDGVAVVTTGGKVVWLDAVNAVARFNPASNDLKASKSPYTARWSVTDAIPKTAWFPDAEPDLWVVRLPTL